MLNISHSNGYIHKVFGNETGLRIYGTPWKILRPTQSPARGNTDQSVIDGASRQRPQRPFSQAIFICDCSSDFAASASAILQRFNGDLIVILLRLLKSLYEVKINWTRQNFVGAPQGVPYTVIAYTLLAPHRYPPLSSQASTLRSWRYVFNLTKENSR